MAYNANLYQPYGQQSYPQPTYQQTFVPQQPQQPQPFDLIIAVSGRNGAEAFQMPPNSRAVLFDDSKDVMYRVSTDGAGYKTVQEFDFAPRATEAPQEAQYVTRDDFDALMAKVDALTAQKPPRGTARKAANDGE